MSVPGANVCATLRAPDGSIVAAGCGTAAPDGFFGAEITTPEASFDAYTLTVSDGTDTIELADSLGIRTISAMANDWNPTTVTVSIMSRPWR